MSDLIKLISTLKGMPFWLLSGLSFASIFFFYLYGSQITGALLDYTRLSVILFPTLTVAYLITKSVNNLQSRKVASAIKFIPKRSHCWWHAAKQKDGKYLTQINISFDASNITERPLRIMDCLIISPKSKILESFVLVQGQKYYSGKYAVPAYGTAEGSISIMAHGLLAKIGQPLNLKIQIVDQTGCKQKLKIECRNA